MAKNENTIPSDKLELFSKLVSTQKDIELKGATMPYTSANGNMFSFMKPDGRLALRLSEEDREAFIKKYKTTLMESHGVIMKEYVTVPEKLLKNTKELSTYFKLSIKYARGLKPKATTRKKK